VGTTYSSSQVASLTGITLRQLQWWDEHGIVVPDRAGHCRLYSPEDLAEIAVICELRRKGFSLQRVRKVMRFLQKELGRRLVETTLANAEVHLLSDGKHLFLEDSERGVIDVLKNAKQPLLAVCLSDAVKRISGELRPTQERRTRRRPAARAHSRGPELRSALRVDRRLRITEAHHDC
jgi:DNA-binding transcriptional MerR regulator